MCSSLFTTTQGKRQAARSFRKNPHSRKGYENQSKFLAGNAVLWLAFLADQMQENGHIQRYCFALGGILLRLSNNKRGEKHSLVRSIERIVPKRFTGFEDCRLRSEQSIEAWFCLSLMATGILEYLRWKLAQSFRPQV